jgi:hypothetical protein
MEVISPIENEAFKGDSLFHLFHRFEQPFPGAALSTALDVIRAIKSPLHRSEALSALIPSLTGEDKIKLTHEAFGTALIVKEDQDRSRVLASIIPCFPDHDRAEKARVAITLAASLTDEEARIENTVNLLQYLPYEERHLLANMMLEQIQGMENEHSRIQMLGQIAPFVTNEEEGLLFSLMKAIESPIDRARALSHLVSRLSEEQRINVLKEQLDTAASVGDWDRSCIIDSFAAFMPMPFLLQAFDMAISIGSEHNRASAIVDIAPFLPEELLLRALQAIADIANEAEKAYAIAMLSKVIPEEMMHLCLRITASLMDPRCRAKAAFALLTERRSVERAHYKNLVEDSIFFLSLGGLPKAGASSVQRDDSLYDLCQLVPIFSENEDDRFAVKVLTILRDVVRWWP